jgi:hypothetical protein
MLLGYSYKSSQYGLAVDNVAGYELVLPNGTAINVTSNDVDLWFGLRVSKASSTRIGITEGLQLQGGMNNFVRYQFAASADFKGLLMIYREL